MSTSELVVVLTTVPLDADAADLARVLVHERLAACVTVLGETLAVYRWQGEVNEDRERQLLIKTSRDRIEALEQRLRSLHPYELPEFVALPVAHSSAAYLAWVLDMTRA